MQQAGGAVEKSAQGPTQGRKGLAQGEISVQGNNKVWHKKGKERPAQGKKLGKTQHAFLMGVIWYHGYTRAAKLFDGEKRTTKTAEVFSCLQVFPVRQNFLPIRVCHMGLL